MKRDWDIIREILIQIESDSLNEWIDNCDSSPCVHDYPNGKEIVLGHLELLIGAGMIQHAEVKRNNKGDFEYWDLRGAYLTMQGHDVLDALRDKSIWGQIKFIASKKKIAITWEFLKASIPVIYSALAKE